MSSSIQPRLPSNIVIRGGCGEKLGEVALGIGPSNALLFSGVTRFGPGAAGDRYATIAREMSLADYYSSGEKDAGLLLEESKAPNEELEVPSLRNLYQARPV